MSYYQKYLKYKNKYLELKNQSAGFIKGKKLEGETIENIKDLIDERMPLCYYDSTKTNFILINDENYILIDKKIDDEYELYQINDKFDINKINKPQEMIKDDNDIIIPGINKVIYGIHLLQAFRYNSENIFRNFFKNVRITAYPYFNRLKDIMYKNLEGQILYQNNINIVLSIIFINKFHDVIRLIYTIEEQFSFENVHHDVSNDDDDDLPVFMRHRGHDGASNAAAVPVVRAELKNYYSYNKTVKNKQFNDIKTDVLYDYINNYDHIMIDSLTNLDTFEKLKDNLNQTFSNIERLCFDEQSKKDDFNFMMYIMEKVYAYVDTPNIIDQYNYSLFIDKYKDFNSHSNDTTYKSLIRFIHSYDENTIKNKLVLKLTCLIYLCYKTNEELLTYNTDIQKKINCRPAQYMLLDYFYGITKIKNFCVPINRRHIMINILYKKNIAIVETPQLLRRGEKKKYVYDSDDLSRFKSTIKEALRKPLDKLEIAFYRIFTKTKFKEIKQYTFNNPTVSVRYTDCGETTILNIFNYFLLKEDGLFNLTEADSWDPELKKFYEKYPSMESMININIETLKKDLSGVFNNRGDKIRYNLKEYQCDIHTTMNSITKTCAFLLNCDTDSMVEIFKKLDHNVKDVDITINPANGYIKYKDIFSLSLVEGHGEFNSIYDNINIPEIQYDLFTHWISLNPRYLPDKFTLDHFKYYFYNIDRFFIHYFPVEKQTEEICLEVVNPSRLVLLDQMDHAGMYNILVNFKKIENKTKKIIESAIKIDPNGMLDYLKKKKELTKELCDIALEGNLHSIQYIPEEFQDAEMARKIILSDDPDIKKYIKCIRLDLIESFENQDKIKEIFESIKQFYVSNLKDFVLLKRYTKLKELFFNFDQPLGNSLNHLDNLESLEFGNKFNQPLGNSLDKLINLKSLKFFSVNSKFNQPLGNSLDKLIKLESLKLGWDYTQPLGISLDKLINLKTLNDQPYVQVESRSNAGAV